MTTIAPVWLRASETGRVIEALAPINPLFVGGCVRDALMDRATTDIDICVAAPPEETLRLAEAAGLSAHPTGLSHGVVTVGAYGRPFEIATLRRDVAGDGRRAVVAFTDRIAEDAARRDFTINALYAAPDGRVIDPLGAGLADLAARRIRFIGDAVARIREDYLRILRFFRFHAQFEIEAFDEGATTACHTEAAGLQRISKERIGAEFLKLLAAPNPEPALAAMGPVLQTALPGAAPFSGLARAEAALAIAPDPIRRLVALEAAAPQAALRLSKAQSSALGAIAAARNVNLEEATYRHGPDAALSALALQTASGATPPPQWRERIVAAAKARFPLTATDLIEHGAAPGPELGAALRALETAWIASGFTATKAELLAQA